MPQYLTIQGVAVHPEKKKKSNKHQASQHASKPNNKKKKIWNRMEQEKKKNCNQHTLTAINMKALD